MPDDSTALAEPAPSANQNPQPPRRAAASGDASPCAADLNARAARDLAALIAKPGIHSSEFLLVLIVVSGCLLASLSTSLQHRDPLWSEMCAGAAAIIFTAIRTGHKTDIAGIIASVFQAQCADPGAPAAAPGAADQKGGK